LIAASFVAVLPHLVLEALSYVTAGLAAVFASLLLTRDDVSGAAAPILKSCARMLVMSVALLVTAAVLESYWTPLVLDAFRDA
jgi:uncharacterized membrane protein SpoIIM required for sporulation